MGTHHNKPRVGRRGKAQSPRKEFQKTVGVPGTHRISPVPANLPNARNTGKRRKSSGSWYAPLVAAMSTTPPDSVIQLFQSSRNRLHDSSCFANQRRCIDQSSSARSIDAIRSAFAYFRVPVQHFRSSRNRLLPLTALPKS